MLNYRRYLPEPDPNTFKCPDCHNRLNIDEAVVKRIRTDTKYNGMSVKGRYIVRSYTDISYRVRFCPKCAKKRTIKKWLYNIITIGVIPSTATLLYIKNWGDFIPFYIMFLAIELIPMGLINIYNRRFKVTTVYKASMGNALEPPFYTKKGCY